MNRETTEAYVLGGIGAIDGAWKYYVKPELTAGRAWAALGAFVLAYDLLSPHGETLSEGVDRALERHKFLTVGAVAVTSAHLLNVLPKRIDPFHQAVKLLRPS